MRIQDKNKVKDYYGEQVFNNVELNIKELYDKKIRLESYPIRVYVEPTQRCNLQCVMCDRSKSSENADMSMALFRKIESELFNKAAEVDFFLYGEPFLSRNFLEMLKTSFNYKFTPKVFTNLTIMNQEIAEVLVKTGAFVNISIDAVNPNLYNKMRVGAKFENVKQNLKFLIETQNKIQNPKFHIRISSTMGAYNIHEAPKIVKFAKEMGVSEVQFGAMDFGLKSTVHLTTDSEKAVFYLKLAHKIADNSKIRFSCPKRIGKLIIASNHNWEDFSLAVDDFWLFEVEGFNPFDKDCGYPWIQTVIRANGDVVSCCQRHNVMGNLNENSFKEIWNGDKYLKLRNQNDFSNCYGQKCNMCHYSIWPYQIKR